MIAHKDAPPHARNKGEKFFSERSSGPVTTMTLRIPLIPSLVYYFRVFYPLAGNTLFVLFIVIALAGIAEGLGLSMLIPLLDYEAAQAGETTSRYTQIVYGLMESVGLDTSLSGTLLLLSGLFAFKAAFMITQSAIIAYVSNRLLEKWRNSFCHLYAELDYPVFTERRMGYFNNIITTETGRALSGFNNYVRVYVSLAYICIYCLAAGLLDWGVTLLALGSASIVFMVLRYLARYVQRLSGLVSSTNADIQNLVLEKLGNYKYLKATASFGPLLANIRTKVEENRKYQFLSTVLAELPSYCMELLAILALAGLILYYVGYQGKTIGEVLVLLAFFYRAFHKVLDFQNVWQRFSSMIGGITVVDKARKDLEKNKEESGDRPVHTVEQAIEFKDVEFSYGDKKALNRVNLSIPSNKSVGIVGPSGAGKTTLFDLLTGLLASDSGIVALDGVDYRTLDKRQLRGMIGYVTQEPVIFDDTIANNIAFWSCDPDEELCMERIKRAADLAGCSGFIQDCPQGFRTRLGEKGVRLSGGQRQRIAIARELFKEPQLLIFDEATSSLDTESEKLIHESISLLKGSFTMVIIAHRLSTIRDCDIIYVLEKGTVVEQGTFEELYRDENSRFRAMCRAQKLQ